jgi:hypothetical protein
VLALAMPPVEAQAPAAVPTILESRSIGWT